MDNYNVLVLMEKDNNTGEFLDTVLSVSMAEGLENVLKAYVLEEDGEYFTYLHLTTPDVADWEFYGIYAEYNDDLFIDLSGNVEELDDYNPAWVLRLPFLKEEVENENAIREAVKLHYQEILRLRESIKARQAEYEAEANSAE